MRLIFPLTHHNCITNILFSFPIFNKSFHEHTHSAVYTWICLICMWNTLVYSSTVNEYDRWLGRVALGIYWARLIIYFVCSGKRHGAGNTECVQAICQSIAIDAWYDWLTNQTWPKGLWRMALVTVSACSWVVIHRKYITFVLHGWFYLFGVV